jgi:hypothetical protein
LFWGRKILLYALFIVVTFITLSFLVFQFPEVQTALTSRYLKSFSQVVGFPTTVGRIDLRWYDRLELRQVMIKDPENNHMISVSKLLVNFGFLDLIANGNINIDEADIDHAVVSLINIKESDTSLNLNINIFIKKINEKFSSGKGGQSSAKLNIGEIALDNSQFIYNEPDKDSIQNAFDYHHFHVDVNDGQFQSFQVIGDTIQFDVKSVQLQDRKTKFKVDELSTYFRISQSSMEFLNTELRAGKSYISDTIIFKYHSQDDLSDFNEKVNIVAKLKNTFIDPKDLALFSYGLPELPQAITLSGSVSGKVVRFMLRDMDLTMGSTRILGRLSMDGLPDINETFIDLKINEGHIVQNDIRFFMPENFYDVVKPLGLTTVRAEFRGFTNDFVAKGDLATSLGNIKSDLNLKVNQQNTGQSTYRGNLSLSDFRLGNYLNDTLNFQRVTLNGRINGKGLTRETADFTLTGQVNSIGFRKYNYSNINTNARLAAQLFNGVLSIDDPNLKFNASGFIDFRKGNELIQVKATLDTAFIDKLGFIKDPLFVHSYFDVNTNGLDLDSLFGSIVLRDTHVKYKDNTLNLDSIHIISEQSWLNRQLKLRSSVFDFSLQGDYRYTPTYNDLQKLAKEFYLSLKNDRKALTEYYKQKKEPSREQYTANFDLLVHDMRPLATLGNLDLFVSPNSTFKGSFQNNHVSVMNCSGKIDTLVFQKKKFIGNEFDFSASKPRDSVRGKSALTIRSTKQEFSRAFKTKNVLAEAKWDRDHVDFTLDADQEGNSNILRMKSSLDFLQDSVKLKILPTQLRIFDEFWGISADNYILLKNMEWSFNNMRVHHGNESASLNGFISSDPSKTLTLNVDSLGLDIINSLVLEKVYGVVDGNVQARDLYHSPFVQNNLTIKDLTVDQFLVGNVKGANEWNREQKRFDLNFSLERDGKRTVEMTGFYDPAQSESPLSVQAKLENANIKIIEPFMRGIFSQMDGALTGNYTITGTFLEPVVNGTGKIEAAQLTIDYLKTKYFFSGELGFNPKQILFKNFAIRDELKNRATLGGYISHRNYSEMRINLDGSFTSFQLLNTTPKDNDLFYGQAYGTGNMNMVGPIDNLKISGTAKSDKGTRIFIPLNGTETTVSKKDFVTFVKFSDSLKTDQKKSKAKPKTKNEPTGITMDMNLDITTDAYAEIIFDIRSGDIIRGYGKGELKLQLDTKGEFNLFGDYEFERGNYNFTLYDIINKEFTINKGSRITWLGDPYGGILNINASYKQLVSFGPILQTQAYASSIAMRRKYPAEVQLKIDGAMLSPQINFDIVANDLPNNVPVEAVGTSPAGSVQLNNEFKAFKAQLNEQELKRQVFSLIMLRRFSPPDAFVATGGSLYSSVSELFSNQLSYWLTQVDQNLEVNFDLGNFDQEAFNTFQLRLSYSFLNGRLRVTRDGAFNNNYNRSEVSNMLGDWTVDYLLTPDGKFKVKMYSRNNINQLLNSSSIGSQAAVTTGFSLMNTQNFNHWRDLLTTARERRRKEMSQQPKKEEEDDGTK